MSYDNLTDDQKRAHDLLVEFARKDGIGIALLQGRPGTGKTYSLKQFVKSFKYRTLFTAPTNKATNILYQTLKDASYDPECCTTYSMLGLRVDTEGELKEIVGGEEPVKLEKYDFIVIDECSMVGSKLLKAITDMLQENRHLKLLFVGDFYQLPPVKELISPVEKMFLDREDLLQITLDQVVRHDGQILDVVNNFRDMIDKPWTIDFKFLEPFKKVSQDNDVIVTNQEGLLEHAHEYIRSSGDFTNASMVAWRNVTVDAMNARVRAILYPRTHRKEFWEVGDKIVLTSPAKDLTFKKSLAHTDETGIVDDVEYVGHPDVENIDCARLRCIMDDNTTKVFYAVAPYDKDKWTKYMSDLHAKAKARAIT